MSLNCLFRPTPTDSIIGPSSGIDIGSEMSGDVYNITVRNVSFSETMFAVRIKSGRGRGGEFTDTMCYMYIVSMIIPCVGCLIIIFQLIKLS